MDPLAESETIKAIKIERDLIVQTFEDEQKLTNNLRQTQQTIKKELKALRDTYDSSYWETVETEDAIAVIEKELEGIRKKLDQLSKARSNTEELEQQLNQIKDTAKQKSKERTDMENLKRKLEDDLKELKRKLKERTESRLELGEQLEQKKKILKRRLQSRTGIEECLIDLQFQIDALTKSVDREIKSREQLELQFDIEVNELTSKILTDSNLKSGWKQQVDEALKIKSNMIMELQSLKNHLSTIVDRLQKPSDKKENNTIADPLIDEVKKELQTMSALLELEAEGVTSDKTIKELKLKLDSECRSRIEIEEKKQNIRRKSK